MWNAWKGALYNARRLLILGESCYSWTDDNGVYQRPQPDHPINLVKTQLKDLAEPIPFMKKLTQSVTSENSPSIEQREAGWRSVGFTNFIPCSVGDGPRGPRPTPAMWAQAAEELRPLLESLKPRNVIVLGVETWRNLPPADVSLNDDAEINAGASLIERARGYRLSDGLMARLWGHWHPSAGASWTSIRDAIMKAEATPQIPGWEHVDR